MSSCRAESAAAPGPADEYAGAKPGLSPTGFVAVVVIALRCAIVVVHGGGVDSALFLAVASLPARASATPMVWRTTSTPPPVSPSAAGGVSRSCIHKFSRFAVLSFSERLSLSSALFALGISPNLAHVFSMRGNPDATGKTILNDLFRLSAWSQWARRASTEAWPLGTF